MFNIQGNEPKYLISGIKADGSQSYLTWEAGVYRWSQDPYKLYASIEDYVPIKAKFEQLIRSQVAADVEVRTAVQWINIIRIESSHFVAEEYAVNQNGPVEYARQNQLLLERLMKFI